MNDSVVKTWEIYRTFFVSYRWMDGEMGGDWHGSSSVSQYIFRKSDDSKVSIPRFNVWKSIFAMDGIISSLFQSRNCIKMYARRSI